MATVVISLLGTVLDQKGRGNNRWDKWRPNVAVCMHPELSIDRFEMILHPKYTRMGQKVAEDINEVSPNTVVNIHKVSWEDPWDFEQVYGALHDFANSYTFDRENDEYYIHITTGTHVAQICLYLLTEAHYFPGKLLQTSPSPSAGAKGQYHIIDLDLSKYDQIAQRFRHEQLTGEQLLKSGISTHNAQFNKLINQLEQVAIRSSAPILLTGPTGAGKSQLARQIYTLKKQRGQVKGEFVAVNCATLHGDNAMSTLFGHKKGAFTGALQTRLGLLKTAHDGLLFLDEIGELGLDEQAMLLKSIEEKTFYPMGSDQPIQSNFQLIAGTNQNLHKAVLEGKFREDLLARINLWSYELPGLRERIEDLEPNLEYELQQFAKQHGSLVTFNSDAKQLFLNFALSPAALWKANFRDLNACVLRMATLAPGGRITENIVQEEILRLKKAWQSPTPLLDKRIRTLQQFLSKETLEEIDLFDQQQLLYVIEVCLSTKNLAEAGRKLFNVSRMQKKTTNDSHRLRTYLGKYNLSFEQLHSSSVS
ncbi:RNA repair transcriptional activator RtcR [Zooshikella harenae]|uniref:RNA repair transcriptional activator RtcR n=1 Tax=Zooshikella harenae TaxID=2827238 RepID=A0ABS5ZEQ7_9GAMM|nr:RNA repair transcriptional activator RtcR [Zooshikella harenae]MBU2712554.1 RNA repair transcriptional activator RtcR [Zooshikella harenae]